MLPVGISNVMALFRENIAVQVFMEEPFTCTNYKSGNDGRLDQIFCISEQCLAHQPDYQKRQLLRPIKIIQVSTPYFLRGQKIALPAVRSANEKGFASAKPSFKGLEFFAWRKMSAVVLEFWAWVYKDKKESFLSQRY